MADDDLREWDVMNDQERELFRRSGEALAAPDELMGQAIMAMRKQMGERAFRRKMFEISISVLIERANPDWSEAERYYVTDFIVKLSAMLDVSDGQSATV